MMHEHCHDIDLYFKKRNDSDKKKLVVSSRIGEREREREKEKKGRKTFHAYIIPLGTSKNVEATTGNISPTFEPDAFRLNNDRIRDAIGSRWHEDAINHPRG